MKKNNRLQTYLLIAAAFAFTSCNRGYGCPYNSLQDSLADLANMVLTFLF